MSKEEKKKGELVMPQLMIALEARDARGNMLKRIRTPANSWLSNFYEVLEMLFAPHATSAHLMDYGKTASLEYNAFFGNNIWDDVMAGASQIGVGSSNATFNKLQSELQSSAEYWATLDKYDESASKVIFGATIACANALTVKEVGFRWYSVKDKNGDIHTVMFERTVLAAADQVDVPAGGSVTASYEMTLP